MFKLTHWGRDKMANNLQTFSKIFSRMKMLEFWFKFHWNLFPRVWLNIYLHHFRLQPSIEQATSHYLNQWWHTSPMHQLMYRKIWNKIFRYPSSNNVFPSHACNVVESDERAFLILCAILQVKVSLHDRRWPRSIGERQSCCFHHRWVLL